MSGKTNNRFLLSLYSSDAGGLTFEGEFATYEEAFARVESWVPEGNDIEVERQSGMWLIEEEIGPRMQYQVQLMALYRGRNFSCSQESEKEHPSYNPVLFESYRTRCHAETYVAKRKRQAEEDNKFDLKEYKRELERVALLKEAGRAYTEPKLVLEIQDWSETIKENLHKDTTIDDLKAMQWPEPGFIGITAPREFKLKSGDVRVTDPCYKMDTWCAGTVTDVATGVWRAQAGHARDKYDMEHSKKHFGEEIGKLEESKKKSDELQAKLDAEIAKIIDPEAKKLAKEAAKENADLTQKWMLDYQLRDLLKWGNPMKWKGRVTFLHIRHESVPADEPIDFTKFTKTDIHVGVDSGQAGFFDLKRFEKEAHDESDGRRNSAFYDACCNKTLEDPESWGTVLGYGVVSSTGYGDGGYDLFVRRNEAGQMIEARITYMLEGNEGFISADEDEEEGDDE